MLLIVPFPSGHRSEHVDLLALAGAQVLPLLASLSFFFLLFLVLSLSLLFFCMPFCPFSRVLTPS